MTKGWLDDWNDDYCCEEHSPGKATQIELAWEQRRKETMANQRLISEVAVDIKREWKKVYFGAVPYLEAMLSLGDKTDYYGADSASSVVTYFLSNATSFRGEKAKALKEELKKIIG